MTACAQGGAELEQDDALSGGRADGSSRDPLVSCWISAGTGTLGAPQQSVVCSAPFTAGGIALRYINVTVDGRSAQLLAGEEKSLWSQTSTSGLPSSYSLTFEPVFDSASGVVGVPVLRASSAKSVTRTHTVSAPLSIAFPFDVWRVSATASLAGGAAIAAAEERTVSTSDFGTATLRAGSFALSDGATSFARVIVARSASSLGLSLISSSLGTSSIQLTGSGHYSIAPGSALKASGTPMTDPSESEAPEDPGAQPSEPAPPEPTCVEGNAYACGSAGGSWNSSTQRCCFTEALQCVSGDAYSCSGSTERWTGSKCCVPAALQCVSGDAYSCSGDGEHWTGSKCCVAAGLCVSGDAYSCSGAGERWTGSVCCVDAGSQCVSGDAYSCSGDGEHWTGSKCCVDAALSCASGSAYSCSGQWTGSLCCS